MGGGGGDGVKKKPSDPWALKYIVACGSHVSHSEGGFIPKFKLCRKNRQPHNFQQAGDTRVL